MLLPPVHRERPGGGRTGEERDQCEYRSTWNTGARAKHVAQIMQKSLRNNRKTSCDKRPRVWLVFSVVRMTGLNDTRTPQESFRGNLRLSIPRSPHGSTTRRSQSRDARRCAGHGAWRGRTRRCIAANRRQRTPHQYCLAPYAVQCAVSLVFVATEGNL